MLGVRRCRLKVLLSVTLLVLLLCVMTVINRPNQEPTAEPPLLIPVSIPVLVDDLLQDSAVPQVQVRAIGTNHRHRSPYIYSEEPVAESDPVFLGDDDQLQNSHEQSPVSSTQVVSITTAAAVSTTAKPLKVFTLPNSKSSVRNNSSISTPVHCKEELCLENLNSQPGDRETFETCHSKTVLYAHEVLHIDRPSINKCSCHFRKSEHNRLVALVSLPGSGNTWVRGLLEKATGICTGSKYCDKSLRSRGFCGEGMISASTVVVKTHDFSLRWQSQSETDDANPVRDGRVVYNSAIFIFRSPYDAAVSEWNRQHGRSANSPQNNNHVSVISNAEYFGSNARWQEFASKQFKKWNNMIKTYILKGRQRVLAVSYEDLNRDEAGEVKRMVQFLGVPYSEEKAGKGFTNFYRNHTDTFDHFTLEQKILFNGHIEELSNLLKDSGMFEYAKKLLDYIRPT